MFRPTLAFALVLFFSLSASAAEIVPLSTSLEFEPLEKKGKSITLLVSPEISQLVVKKKMRLMRFEFPLGNAVAMNTESALRSAFAKVRLARTEGEVETDRALELKAIEIEPRMPMTTFGTFSSKVKVTFVLHDRKKKSSREIVVTGDGGNKKHAGRVIWESGWKWTEAQQFARATDLATLDALDKLLAELTAK